MIRLHLLLRDHPDAVEADLLRFWGVDLLDHGRRPRRLSTRRLLVLWRHIPHGQGSAVHAIEGPEWGAVEDLLDDLRRWYVVVHGEGHKDPGPHPMSPAHRRDEVGPNAAGLELARRLRAERESKLAAGEL
jgi:hypothetical protein